MLNSAFSMHVIFHVMQKSGDDLIIVDLHKKSLFMSIIIWVEVDFIMTLLLIDKLSWEYAKKYAKQTCFPVVGCMPILCCVCVMST